MPAVKSATQQKSGPAEGEVRACLRKGDTGRARRLAQDLYRRQPTSQAAALLLETFQAHLASLLSRGLVQEARQVRELAAGLPVVEDGLQEFDLRLEVRGSWQRVLREAGDPDLPAERRELFERVVRTDLADLNLPISLLEPGHPLRAQAEALSAAFEAVTSRPVEDPEVELREIPRRSPLAPWKFLIRALTCWYRGDRSGCEQWVDGIAPDAAVARSIPVLRSLCGGPEPADPASTRLLKSLRGDRRELREALEGLEVAFEKERPRRILERLGQAVKLCRREAPDCLEGLLCLAAARCPAVGISTERLRSAVGCLPRPDAAFWELMARASERDGAPAYLAVACWKEFAGHARAEGLLPARGPEPAALHLRMIGLLEGEGPVRVDRARVRNWFRDWYRDQPAQLIERSAWFAQRMPRVPADPGSLYREACRCDPQPETFRRWLAWASREQPGQRDRAAEAWHCALPHQAEPLLALATLAEGRHDFNRALSLLDKARQLDPLSSEPRDLLRKCRFRAAWNELRHQGRGLSPAVATLEPETWGEAILARTLRWYTSTGKTRAEALQWLESQLGGREAAHRLVTDLAAQAGVRAGPWQGETGLRTVALAFRALAEVHLPYRLPRDREASLLEELERTSLDPGELLCLALASGTRCRRLAFEATRRGLASGQETGWFLALRAALHLDPDRVGACLGAARELALRANDGRLRDAVAELTHRLKVLAEKPVGPPEDVARAEAALKELPVDLPWLLMRALAEGGTEAAAMGLVLDALEGGDVL